MTSNFVKAWPNMCQWQQAQQFIFIKYGALTVVIYDDTVNTPACADLLDLAACESAKRITPAPRRLTRVELGMLLDISMIDILCFKST